MQKPNFNIEIKKEESKVRNERQHLISQFVERLNASRVQAKYKPLPPSAYAIKMAHIITSDLHAFYKQCEQASCGFSRAYWYSLRK